MAGESRVVSAGFHTRVYDAVRRVPSGFVTTYGDIATILGSSRVARHVGWALAALHDPDVPWHRVVNAKGIITHGDAGRGSLQRSLLEREGVRFLADGRVDLAHHRWAIVLK